MNSIHTYYLYAAYTDTISANQLGMFDQSVKCLCKCFICHSLGCVYTIDSTLLLQLPTTFLYLSKIERKKYLVFPKDSSRMLKKRPPSSPKNVHCILLSHLNFRFNFVYRQSLCHSYNQNKRNVQHRANGSIYTIHKVLVGWLTCAYKLSIID